MLQAMFSLSDDADALNRTDAHNASKTGLLLLDDAAFNVTSDPHSRVHDAELYDVPVGLLVLLSLLYGTISLLAIIGNSLVIWIVATTRQMQSITNLFIANLALADVIIGMFAIPFQFHAAVLQRWVLPDFMCTFCPYVQMVSVNVSVFTLTAIAVDRHRAIINPLRARPSRFVCKIAICLIWIVSLLFAVPIAIALRVVQTTELLTFADGEMVTYTKPFCDNVNLTWDEMKRYRYCLVLFQYMVPFCVISFVYIQMAVRLWGSKTPGNAQDSRDVTLMRNKKKVIKMLIIVVLLFGICWFPLQLYQVLQVTFTSINEYRYINIVWFCSDWLAMSNSCYNPFIYGIYNKKFKREFQRRFPLFRPGGRRRFADGLRSDASDLTVSMYTRASSVRSTGASQSRQKALQFAVDTTTAAQRSSSFQFVGGKTGGKADIRLEDAQLWSQSGQKTDINEATILWTQIENGKNADETQNEEQQQNRRCQTKVMFQHVSDRDDDCIGSPEIFACANNGTKRFLDSEYVQL